MKTEKSKFNLNLEVEYEYNPKYKKEIERKIKENIRRSMDLKEGVFSGLKFWQFKFFRVLSIKEKK